jgi:hypothetical protein
MRWMGKTTDGYCPKNCSTRADGRNADEREISSENVTEVSEHDDYIEVQDLPTQISLQRNKWLEIPPNPFRAQSVATKLSSN